MISNWMLLAVLQPISEGLEGSLGLFRVHTGTVEGKGLLCLTYINLSHNRRRLILLNCWKKNRIREENCTDTKEIKLITKEVMSPFP